MTTNRGERTARPRDLLGVLTAADGWLRERGSPTPRLDAELLLAHALGIDRLGLYLAFDRPLDDAELARCRELVLRRGAGEPVAYLTGRREFMSLAFAVTPAVLIPRPATELLVEHAARIAPRDGSVVDLGTGSGNIAVALARARTDLRIVATDVVPEALEVARGNATRHACADRITFVLGSWWEPLRGQVFDVVVSNPPYVDPGRTDLVDPAVAAHEPPQALFSAAGDPLSAYRAIAAGVATGVTGGGSVLLEVGVDTAEPVRALLRSRADLADVTLVPDLAGLPRMLEARRRA